MKSALGKKRRDGKAASLRPLTAMQRVHVGKLIEKYGDDYQVLFTLMCCQFSSSISFLVFAYKVILQAMFMDTALNAMQHSVAALKKLCERYYVGGKHYITS